MPEIRHKRFTPLDLKEIDANVCQSHVCRPETRMRCEATQRCSANWCERDKARLIDMDLTDFSDIKDRAFETRDYTELTEVENRIRNVQHQIFRRCRPIEYVIKDYRPELPRHLSILMRDACKTTGTLNPDENLPLFEEYLTEAEYDEVRAFYQWCVDNNRTFGHNIQSVYRQFRKETS